MEAQEGKMSKEKTMRYFLECGATCEETHYQGNIDELMEVIRMFVEQEENWEDGDDDFSMVLSRKMMTNAEVDTLPMM